MTNTNPPTAPTDKQVRVRLKFCGMTRAEDYRQATALGADHAGFIFHPKSPRYVSPEQVRSIADVVQDGIPRVGVFVDDAVEDVLRISRIAGLSVIQLHGGQDGAFAKAMPLPCWKVIRLKEVADLDILATFPADTFLLDAFVKDQPGGTGQSIPHDLLSLAIQRGRESGKQVWFAGGLSPENMHEILSLHPYGVDVNSGVEISPGIKDHGRMKRVADQVRAFKP